MYSRTWYGHQTRYVGAGEMPSGSSRMLRVTGHEIVEYAVALVILVLAIAIITYEIAYALPGGLTTLSTAAFTSERPKYSSLGARI